jgi:sarcosine oxidase subunit beta
VPHDVIVIGAGVIGSATSFELARRGRRVLCVDAGSGVGAGSTSSSSAIIRFHYSTADSVLTAWEAAAMWEPLEDHLGVVDPDGMCRFVPTGCLVLDWPDSNRASVVALMRDVGVAVEELSPAEIRARFPALDTGDFSPPRPVDDPAFAADAHGELGGYFTPEAGFIDDPMLAAKNFMFAAHHHGAELRLNARVVEIRQAGGKVLGVTLASGEQLDAPVVVNVAGPAAKRINQLAGVAAEMRIGHGPLRQEVHVAEALPGFDLATGTLVADVGTGTYFRPHLANTILVGGTEPECDPLHWVDDPDDYNELPTVEGFEANLWRAARRLPELGIPHRPVGLAALYDASDDWVPIYDGSSLHGFFMACGTSGNQFKNAPMSGIFMAALVEAADQGVDHDRTPVQVVGPRTGRSINVGAFSRLREKAVTSGTVMG